MNAENTIPVDDKDVEFLTYIQETLKSLGHPVRLIWFPAMTRRSKEQIKPTEVTLIAEEQCFVEYVKFELNRHRASRQHAKTIIKKVQASADANPQISS